MAHFTVRIAVDFDGTLFRENRYGELHLIPGARAAMEKMHRHGYYIIIYTCRTGIAEAHGDLRNELSFIHDALVEHSIPFDEIYVGEKLIADAYIDDRGVAFKGDWEKAMDDLESLVHKRKGPLDDVG